MINDLKGKAVLITGGTMGIGLATALAFAREGAQTYLTNKWGTADEDALLKRFSDEKLLSPVIMQADIADAEAMKEVLDAIKAKHDHVEAFISNVAVALVIKGLEDYKLRSLFKSIEYSAWPMFQYTEEIKKLFGKYPRYVVGLSSVGPDRFVNNYDFVAASKSVMETLCRYMNYRLFDQDIRINVVRARMVMTEALRNTIGGEFEDFSKKFNHEKQFVSAEEVAGTVLGLCSGLLDGVSGQVIMVDKGIEFFDNIMRLYAERDELGL